MTIHEINTYQKHIERCNREKLLKAADLYRKKLSIAFLKSLQENDALEDIFTPIKAKMVLEILYPDADQ